MDGPAGGIRGPGEAPDGPGERGRAGSDGEQLSPAQLLALARDQQSRAAAELLPDVRRLYGLWAGTWTAGFGLVYLAENPGGLSLLDPVPVWLIWAVFAALLGSAMLATTGHVVRRMTALRGSVRRKGWAYLADWTLELMIFGLMVAAVATIGQTVDDTRTALTTLFVCLIVSSLLLTGALLWRDRSQAALGVWLLWSTLAAGSLGAPESYLAMTVAGGAGFALAALWTGRHRSGRESG